MNWCVKCCRLVANLARFLICHNLLRHRLQLPLPSSTQMTTAVIMMMTMMTTMTESTQFRQESWLRNWFVIRGWHRSFLIQLQSWINVMKLPGTTHIVSCNLDHPRWTTHLVSLTGGRMLVGIPTMFSRIPLHSICCTQNTGNLRHEGKEWTNEARIRQRHAFHVREHFISLQSDNNSVIIIICVYIDKIQSIQLFSCALQRMKLK